MLVLVPIPSKPHNGCMPWYEPSSVGGVPVFRSGACQTNALLPDRWGPPVVIVPLGKLDITLCILRHVKTPNPIHQVDGDTCGAGRCAYVVTSAGVV